MDQEYETEEEDEHFSFFRPNRPFRIHDTPETVVRRVRSFRRELGAPPRWQDRDLLLVKYIDDFNCCEKIDISSAPFTLSQKKKLIEAETERTTALYREIKERAGEIGMRINNKKTQVLCVSPSVESRVDAILRPSELSLIHI